ncbi:CRISPR/Cas system-associated endonuclease Cas1 [Virgibacillus natechei]|uniref:CRISPR/Cas system-associated endonuclease Cas1 n=1 Tax=Virgibacillus natechei TaxID=1216297 RepID=A0ABS4IGN9_9BACI|nr:sporulation protein [Virgibacillus natechei]MBP1970111.1 CRISPR/Cas system-associated endonuclease Cas1 [Virgibacillus natechei]UZD14189.1 sigma-G-dependent sporulation-specific acid-soluble spore protein CsgA [Virgibacillus natechei]
MDHTLSYLRESLSNYMENDMCQQIVKKMQANKYANEEELARDLDEEETSYLNQVLENELDYAKNVQDDSRVKGLNEVHELLF